LRALASSRSTHPASLVENADRSTYPELSAVSKPWMGESEPRQLAKIVAHALAVTGLVGHDDPFSLALSRRYRHLERDGDAVFRSLVEVCREG